MVNAVLPKLATAFAGEDAYRERTGGSYSLLPFRFLALDEQRYIATNIAGEYVVLPKETLRDFATHRLAGDHPVYDELKAKHFLMDGDSSVALDLLACKYRTKQSSLASLTSLFMFVVTLRCEHSCPYCQVSRQSQDRAAYDMSKEHAQRGLEFVFASPSRHVKIEFQGGEPLLNFELIQWIVLRAEERNQIANKDVAFVIATNLALVTDEILAFCRDHQVMISTSLDGPRDLHNANRPRRGNDSYERAIAGINAARSVLGHDSVSALMTTTKASLGQPEAIIDEYVQQGFHSIFLRSLSPFGFAVKTGAILGYVMDEWLQFYKRGLTHILKLNAEGTVFREEYASLLLRKMLTPFPTGYVDLQSPAGAGISCLAFNYDGSIYASDEARMLAEMRDTTFKIGHLASDTFESVLTSDRLLEYLSSTMTESMPMCSDCGIQPYCGSDPVFHHATQGDMVGFKPTSSFCRKNMELVRYLTLLLEDDSSAKAVLRTWIH